MWAVFGDSELYSYFAVKHAGHQTPECIANVEQKIQQFCPLFQKLCVAGKKEPTPKFHVLKEHMLCFIRMSRTSWRRVLKKLLRKESFTSCGTSSSEKSSGKVASTLHLPES